MAKDSCRKNKINQGSIKIKTKVALLRLVEKLTSSIHAQPKPGGENCQIHSNYILDE
jgi:hypothetical protein